MDPLEVSVDKVRRFNRFFTRTIGVLNETLSRSEFTLAESRVLFELGHGEALGAVDIARDLRLDAAYLARILRRFREAGLVTSRTDRGDGRRRWLELTGQGREKLDALQASTRSEIGALIAPLGDARRRQVTEAMGRIEAAFDAGAAGLAPICLRAHRPGDIGWVIGRQASLYAAEYGWTIEFEGLLAEICAGFIRDFDPDKEACWIAERGGERLGAVFLVRQDDETAKLRMLHVERAARGQGIGAMLVDCCIAEARARGYRTLTLWTNSVLVEARRLYERAGFVLTKSEPHRSFGKDLEGQYWELKL